MKTLKAGVMLLVILFAAMAMVPIVSASDSQSVNFVKPDRNQIAAQLWGKNITQEEFIKNVFPEMYNNASDCQKKAYSSKMMNWLHPKKGNKLQAGTYSEDGQLLTPPSKSSQIIDSNAIAAVVPLTYGSSTISANGRAVYHKSESWVAFPPYLNIPYIGVASFLIKDSNGQETVVDTALYSQYWVNNLKAEQTPTVTSSGNYITEGLHVFQFEPSVCCPNEQSYYTLSNEIYVS